MMCSGRHLAPTICCPICFWERYRATCLPGLSWRLTIARYSRTTRLCAFGQCELKSKPHVRPPNVFEARNLAWRRVDPKRDRCLKWGDQVAASVVQTVKDSRTICFTTGCRSIGWRRFRPNKALQPTAAAVYGLPGPEVFVRLPRLLSFGVRRLDHTTGVEALRVTLDSVLGNCFLSVPAGAQPREIESQMLGTGLKSL